MKKIGDSTNTANSSGEWSEGNPAQGLPATLIKADWLNTIQRELVAVVTGAGIALDKLEDSQLITAINKLIGLAADFDKIKNKPTSLSGYGITDAMPKGAGGLMTTVAPMSGKVSDLSANQFVALGDLTTDKPPTVAYAVGLHLKYPDEKYGFDFVSGITAEWFGVRRNGRDGTGAWRELWHAGNFNPDYKANKATTLAGYGISDAMTAAEVRAAIADIVSSAPESLDTLKELAEALGGDPHFATTVLNALGGKAGKATTLGGYGITDAMTTLQVNQALAGKLDKSGGTVTGALVINRTSQGNGVPGVLISNPDTGAANSLIGLATVTTAVSLIHQAGTNSVTLRNAANNYADIDAGVVSSFGSACHSVASFFKPIAGQWVGLSGSAVLPAGGTWAYFAAYFNGSGAALGSVSGVAAGGTAVGGGVNSMGFAWRIQ